jgi:hypothetical protein
VGFFVFFVSITGPLVGKVFSTINGSFVDLESHLGNLEATRDRIRWICVVFVPIFLPPMLIAWAIWKFLSRKSGKPASQ